MATRSQVDFYVLREDRPEERDRFACRLTEKIWKMGHRVFINTDSAASAKALDTLLWTFSQESFVPHAVDSGEATPPEPVLIGAGNPPRASMDVLLNLSQAAPEWALDYPRVAELIPPDPEGKAAGRARYRYYRDQGCEVRTHNV